MYFNELRENGMMHLVWDKEQATKFQGGKDLDNICYRHGFIAEEVLI